jgi:hypothetical protein
LLELPVRIWGGGRKEGRGKNRNEKEEGEQNKARRKSMPHCKQVGAVLVMNVYRAAV